MAAAKFRARSGIAGSSSARADAFRHSGFPRGLNSVTLGVVLLAAFVPQAHAQTAPPGYTVSNYAIDLPGGTVSGMAIDTDTRTIYYAITRTSSPLRKIAPNGTVTTVANNIGIFGFYPYIATDLEYSAGGVFLVSNQGNVVRTDVVTGAVTNLASLYPGGNESGCVIPDGVNLYATDGTGGTNAIRSLNLNTLVQTTVASGIPFVSSGLEYNAVRDCFYFTEYSAGRLWKMTPAGVVSLVASGLGGGSYNFAIEPSGAAAYVRTSSIVRRVDLTTGVVTNFVTGLFSSPGDIVVGPSSVGNTWSLYIANTNRIVEVRGFVNNSNSIPTVTCPSPMTLGCDFSQGVVATVTVAVADADDDPLTVTWNVNTVQVSSKTLSPGATSASLNHAFGFGANAVSVSVTDGNSDPVTCDTSVTVTLVDAPDPDVPSLPDVTGECMATIATVPTAHVCSDGSIVSGTTTDPLNYNTQGTFTVTWTYTDPNAAEPGAPNATSTQTQTVIVKDITPPVVTCPSDVMVAFGAEPVAATTPAGFIAQGGTITDNCDPNGEVSSEDVSYGFCPMVITRTYTVTDAVGNASGCVQTITVDNLFAEDGIMWHQPLARRGMSEDTDPSAGGTLKYGFKLGKTIPIKIHAVGCDGNVTENANVTGTVVVYGDTDMDGVADGKAIPIHYSGGGGMMDKVGPHLKYNLDTKTLKAIADTRCYLLEVTVTDTSTGEAVKEMVSLQAK